MQAWMRFLIQVLDAFPGSMPTAVGNSVRTPDPDHEGQTHDFMNKGGCAS